MPVSSPVKRTSMFGGLSVADRAKSFQSEVASAIPVVRRARKTEPCLTTQTCPLASLPSSSAYLPQEFEASASSLRIISPEGVNEESEAVIKHARRISVSTPRHRRASSDVSSIDTNAGLSAEDQDQELALSDPISIASLDEIEQLAAGLNAKRTRSKTLAYPTRRDRTGSVLMHSIAEENLHLRLCSSSETIRPYRSTKKRATTTLKDHLAKYEASPGHSEDGLVDWHRFVSGDYSMQPPSKSHQSMSINGLAVSASTRKHVYDSKLSKEDSPTLNDEATWLEEELADCCSSSEDDDEVSQPSSLHRVARPSMDEDEYLTPEGSPLLSPVNIMAPPSVEVMGLGIQDASLLMPGQSQNDAAKSADSLLEQVILLEACAQSLRALSHDEREKATAPSCAGSGRDRIYQGRSMTGPRLSCAIPRPAPTLRGVASRGDFCATQIDSSALFGEASYDCGSSPMADNGHGSMRTDFGSHSTGERRDSAASHLSTDSATSADLSIASHGSSLLYNAHLAAPRTMRVGSIDTTTSTRRSSVASSIYSHEHLSVKEPISPIRVDASPSPSLPQEACETPQPPKAARIDLDKMPEGMLRMAAMPLPPLPHEAAQADRPGLMRKVSRRKEGTKQPQLPARLDSLEAAVAAAPGEMQLKEEFPQRLLGDWMNSKEGQDTLEQQQEVKCSDEGRAVSVEPVPLHKRIHHKDGTTYLPGLGEIVPASPDVGAYHMAMLSTEIPVYPAARKRLGLEAAPSMLTATDLFVAHAATGMNKAPVSLKSKLSGRFRLSSSSKDEVSETDVARKTERKGSDSPSVLGRMRKASAASTASTSSRPSGGAALEPPSAWKDRISIRGASFDMRRPSFASLTSISTDSSSSSSTTASTSASTATTQTRSGGATLLPTPLSKGITRSRSSLGFRKMFTNNKSSPNESDTSAVTLQALAASTFESPKSARRTLVRPQQQSHESFMELSDDDDDSLDTEPVTVTERTTNGGRGRARKDLTKMFGTSDVDPSQLSASAGTKEKSWSSTLARSTKTRS